MHFSNENARKRSRYLVVFFIFVLLLLALLLRLLLLLLVLLLLLGCVGTQLYLTVVFVWALIGSNSGLKPVRKITSSRKEDFRDIIRSSRVEVFTWTAHLEKHWVFKQFWSEVLHWSCLNGGETFQNGERLQVTVLFWSGYERTNDKINKSDQRSTRFGDYGYNRVISS